jgi:hypothetical protein
VVADGEAAPRDHQSKLHTYPQEPPTVSRPVAGVAD